MKKILLSLVLGSLVLSARADFLIQPNDVLGIAGDSITQQHMYSVFMEDYLLMCQPTPGQKITNFGWSGERAPGFFARLQTDVYPLKPTIMTTCYGMNDGSYGPLTDQVGNTYKKAQADIVDALMKNGVRTVVLGSSKCVDSYYYKRNLPPGQAEIYNKTLGAMADMDKQIAADKKIPYADVYGITYDVMQKAKAKFGETYEFAGNDGVHPGANGQLVMAYAFLKALGCDGNIGTITVDLGAKSATGTPGQEIVSDTDGVVTVKSTRYPFCFSGNFDDKAPTAASTAAVTTVFPFNEDLNRYLLVVKGVRGNAKVTWGDVTKEYTGDQLAKGVNLAAEFAQNPFSKQSDLVYQAVRAQQEQETIIYQQITHSTLKNAAPGIEPLLDQILQAAYAQHEKLYQAAQALVVPITHTIKIEPGA